MNFYQGLLFSQGYLLDPRATGEEPNYAEGYGSRVANRRAFPELGHARAHAPALPPAPAALTEACTAGGCG